MCKFKIGDKVYFTPYSTDAYIVKYGKIAKFEQSLDPERKYAVIYCDDGRSVIEYHIFPEDLYCTEQEVKEAGNWVATHGVPLGWGFKKDVLKLLGQEIVDPKLLEICEREGMLRIPSNTSIPTAYYVEIKQKEIMKQYRFKTKEEFPAFCAI